MHKLMNLPTSGTLIYFMVIVKNVTYLDIKLLIVEGSMLKEMKISDTISIKILDLKTLLSEIEMFSLL